MAAAAAAVHQHEHEPIDVKFLRLRSALEKAHYSDALGLESLQLVEKLFGDVQLLQRSERDAEARERDLLRRLQQSQQQQVAPLTRDNARLTDANNALHSQLLSSAEKMDAIEANWKKQVDEYQAQAANYRYLFNTQNFRMKALETENTRMKDRIQSLLERSHAFQNASGAWSGPKQTMEITNTLDGDWSEDSVPSSAVLGASSTSSASRPPNHTDHSELLEIANRKIVALESQLRDTESVSLSLREDLERQKKHGRAKDEEIARLCTNSTRECSAEICDGPNGVQHESESQTIVQLNEQIDFLTSEMLTLEKELERYKSVDEMVLQLQAQRDALVEQVEVLKKKNSDLSERLERASSAAEQLQAEKRDELSNSKSRLPRAVKDLEKAQAKIRHLESRLAKMKADREQQDKEDQQVQEVYESYQKDKETLSEMLRKACSRADSAEADVHRLEDVHRQAVRELEQCNRDLEKAKESLRQAHSDIELHQESIASLNTQLVEMRTKVGKAESVSQQLQSNCDTLSADNSHIKEQLAATLSENSELRSRVESCFNEQIESARDSTAFKQEHNRAVAQLQAVEHERDQYRDEVRQLTDLLESEKQSLAIIMKQHSQCAAELAEAQATTARLDKERQSLLSENSSRQAELVRERGELSRLRVQLEHLQSRIEPLRLAESQAEQQREQHADVVVHNHQMQRLIDQQEDELRHLKASLDHANGRHAHVIKQRDALSALIRNMDANLIHIQSQIRSVADERDHFRLLHEQAQNELNVRAASRTQEMQASATQSSVLREVHSEKATLQLKLQQAEQAERDAQQEAARARDQVSRLQQERDKYVHLAQEDQRKQLKAESQNAEIQSLLGVAETEKTHLRRQLDVLQSRIGELQAQLQQEKAQVRQMRTLHAQLEHAKEEAQRRVDMNESNLAELRGHLSEHERAGREQKLELDSARDALQQHKIAIQKLDAERDRVQHLLDLKSEELARARHEQSQLQERDQAASCAVAELERKLEAMRMTIAAKDGEIASVVSANDELVAQTASLQATLQLKTNEVAALSCDLANMTKENQFVNGELSVAVHERDTRAQEAAAAAAKLAYADERVRVLQRELDDVLANYRLLADEAQRARDAASALDAQCSAHVDELRRLHEQDARAAAAQQHLRDDNQRLLRDLQQFERQNDALTRSLSSVHSQLDESRVQHASLLDDLSSTRSLSHGLEHDRDAMQRRLADDQQLRSSLHASVQQLEAQLDAASTQQRSYQERIADLEQLVAKLRVQAAARNDGGGGGASVSPQRLDDQSRQRVQQLEEELAMLRKNIVIYEMQLSKKEEEVWKSKEKINSGAPDNSSAAASDDGVKDPIFNASLV